MKKTLSILIIAAVLAASGCSAGNSAPSAVPTTEESAPSGEELAQTAEHGVPTVDSAEEPSVSSGAPAADTAEVPAATSAAETAESPAEGGFVLTGPGGDIVKPEELTRVTALDEADYIANGINSGNWEQAEASGFTYLAEPGGELRRVRLGEKICGLTLMDCGCVFSAEREVQPGEYSAQSWFSSAWAEFDGSAELTGTFEPVYETNDIAQAGEYLFTADEAPELPVMDYKFSGDTGVTAPPAGTYPVIVVRGKDLPGNTHGTVVLTGFSMSAVVNGSSVVRADVSEFTPD